MTDKSVWFATGAGRGMGVDIACDCHWPHPPYWSLLNRLRAAADVILLD